MNFSRAGAKIDWGISRQFFTCSISPVHWAWSVRCCVLPLLWIRLLWHARGNRSQTLWPPPFCLFLCRAVVRFFFGDLSFLLWKLHRNGAKSQAYLWVSAQDKIRAFHGSLEKHIRSRKQKLYFLSSLYSWHISVFSTSSWTEQQDSRVQPLASWSRGRTEDGVTYCIQSKQWKLLPRQ